jgi:hypothetical protein
VIRLGIRRSELARDEVFVETKVLISDYGYDATLHAFDKSAGKLGLDQLDLRILHQALPDEFNLTIEAKDAAAMLRLEAGRNPHDKALIELVGELSTRSELFRQRWASQDVLYRRSGRKRLRHPVVGQLDLDFEAMELPSEPGLQLNIYTAAEGTPTSDGLKLLASWAASQEAMPTEQRASPTR